MAAERFFWCEREREREQEDVIERQRETDRIKRVRTASIKKEEEEVFCESVHAIVRGHCHKLMCSSFLLLQRILERLKLDLIFSSCLIFRSICS